MLWEGDCEAASLALEASDILRNHAKMVGVKNYRYLDFYVNYYRAQAGNGLPAYQDVPVMYGADVGGIFL